MCFGYVVWVWVIVIFRWLCFILFHWSHPKRWVAVVPRSNYAILAVDLWGSSAQHLVRSADDSSLGSSAFTSTMLLYMVSKVLTIHWILEGVSAKKNPEATLLFVDFSKALDSIHRGKIEQILLAYGLPKETVTAIMMLSKLDKPDMQDTAGEIRTNS